MLPRKFRLQKNYQFKYIYSHGASFYSKPIVLIKSKARPNSLRIGISVSNKIGKAVFRNRVKRLLREAIREHLASIPRGHNYIFAASTKYDFAGTPYDTISGAVLFLIKKSAEVKSNK